MPVVGTKHGVMLNAAGIAEGREVMQYSQTITSRQWTLQKRSGWMVFPHELALDLSPKVAA